MKILFVYSLDEIYSILKPVLLWSQIPLGISYLSSVLKSHGHQTQAIVLGSNKIRISQQLLASMMEDFDPDIVCSTAVASQYPFINKIAAYTKNKWRNKLLIIGGPHTTLNPDEVINGAFDILCIGEGEYPLEELCTQLENNGNTYGIPNLWIKIGKGVIEKNPTRPFLPNLDVLPFPDRELWKPWVDEKTATAEWSVLLGRGCPYNCTYCSNHVLKKIAPGRYVRMRSPSNIIQEISSIHENYPESKRNGTRPYKR
jgi:radical SAM superfamily enzyme YgiQ (UPF0313 family)